MKYTTIFFDIDDTLLKLEEGKVWEKMFQKLLLKHGLTATHEEYVSFTRHNSTLWKDAEAGKIQLADIFTNRFDLPFLQGIGESAATLDDEFQEMQKKEIEPTEGALSCCQKLSKYASLYAASNGKQTTQAVRVEDSVLAPYITKVYTSDRLHALKPNHDFFENLFTTLNITDPTTVLMVGDTYSEDILGAYQFGIDSCWVNRKHTTVPEFHLCTYTVDNLGELPALLGV